MSKAWLYTIEGGAFEATSDFDSLRPWIFNANALADAVSAWPVESVGVGPPWILRRSSIYAIREMVEGGE